MTLHFISTRARAHITPFLLLSLFFLSTLTQVNAMQQATAQAAKARGRALQKAFLSTPVTPNQRKAWEAMIADMPKPGLFVMEVQMIRRVKDASGVATTPAQYAYFRKRRAYQVSTLTKGDNPVTGWVEVGTWKTSKPLEQKRRLGANNDIEFRGMHIDTNGKVVFGNRKFDFQNETLRANNWRDQPDFLPPEVQRRQHVRPKTEAELNERKRRLYNLMRGKNLESVRRHGKGKEIRHAADALGLQGLQKVGLVWRRKKKGANYSGALVTDRHYLSYHNEKLYNLPPASSKLNLQAGAEAGKGTSKAAKVRANHPGHVRAPRAVEAH